MKNLYLVGATGSIGRQVLEIVDRYPEDFRVLSMTAKDHLEDLSALIEQYHPEFVSIGTEESARILKNRHPEAQIGFGDEGLIQAATWNAEDRSGLLVNAVVGSSGLAPTYHAIDQGRSVALANKESLVIGGDLIMPLARKKKVTIYPVDSEHSAIWQCLWGNDRSTVKRLIITASGGAFRNKTRKELETVTPEDALRHPNWSMGAKITIDSATMMNKGFEVLEAHHLFDLPSDQIQTILHPESFVHSLVEFVDGSLIAQLSDHDMRLPITLALFEGKRRSNPTQSLDLASIGKLNFSPMDFSRFPCLGMAYEALQKGGIVPCVLNAANEAAVQLFLKRTISFLEIESIIRRALTEAPDLPNPSLVDLIDQDRRVKDNIFRQYVK